MSATDVWAVGYYSVIGGSGLRCLIERWNGKRWSIVPFPTGGASDVVFTGVATVPGTNDVWAVGGLDELWNGKNWTIQDTGVGGEILSVTALSSTDVWGVGFQASVYLHKPVVDHWNGKTWAAVSSPAVQYEGDLPEVTALSPSDAWAVGTTSASTTITEHWDGVAFRLLSSHWVRPITIARRFLASLPGR